MDSVYNMSKFDLAKKFGCEISEVVDAKSEILTPEKLEKTKVIRGFVNMPLLQLTSLGSVEVIVGDSFGIEDAQGRVCAQGILISEDATDLSHLKTVYGNVSSVENAETNFGGIKNIYGNVYLNHTKTKSLGKIKNIFGVLSLDHSKIETLGKNIKHIDDIIATTNLKLQDFGSLLSFNRIMLGKENASIPTMRNGKPLFVFDENEMLYTTKDFTRAARIENLSEAERVMSAHDFDKLNKSIYAEVDEANWMRFLADSIKHYGYDISFVTSERKEKVPFQYYDEKIYGLKTINIIKSVQTIRYRVSASTMEESVNNANMVNLIKKVNEEFVRDEETGVYNRNEKCLTDEI